MKKISRAQAEKLFLQNNVIQTKVEYHDDALRVRLILRSGKSFLMQYDTKKNCKSYFVMQ
jgi:hypothetical protein